MTVLTVCRILYEQTDFPLLSVCFDQWPLPRELNATELQLYGSPCPGNTWYYACCNDAFNCFAWSSSTQALACNSYQPNCCSTPSNNYTGKMVFPPRPGMVQLFLCLAAVLCTTHTA